MNHRKTFATQTLLLLAVGNAVLIALAILLAGNALLLAGVGVLLTVGLWLGIRQIGVRAINEAGSAQAIAPPAERPAVPETTAPSPQPEPTPPVKPEQPPEAAAIQMLAILQRKGRLIDFLQEDIAPFADDQIGAAVRNVHAGCREALAEHVTLEPVLDQPEGSRVTIEPGFDAGEIRLTGNVAGDPPFTGALQHRGWRAVRVELPELMQTQRRVVAAAEVEIG